MNASAQVLERPMRIPSASESRIKGAQRVTTNVKDENGVVTEMPVQDAKGRQVWDMPPGDSKVRHFKSEATKRAFAAGKMSIEEATHLVDVYRTENPAVHKDINSRLRKSVRDAQAKAAAKKAERKAKAKAKKEALAAMYDGDISGEDALEAKSVAEAPKVVSSGYWTPELAAQAVQEHGSIRAAARAHGKAESGLRPWVKKAKEAGLLPA